MIQCFTQFSNKDPEALAAEVQKWLDEPGDKKVVSITSSVSSSRNANGDHLNDNHILFVLFEV